MTIGEKIQQIRTEKNFSQDSIYKQSTVSQIEQGINKHPAEWILREIAQKLEITFDELIEGTDWETPRNVTAKSEYAFSQTECIVIMDNPGAIKIQMKSYPAVENTGEVNKFDPDTGYKLLNECKSCKRSIQQNNQKYCFGCGDNLFSDYSFNERIFSTSSISYDTAFNTEYSHDIDKNKEVINNLSLILLNNHY